MPPTLKPISKPDFQSDPSLSSQLKKFNSNLNCHCCILFQHRICLNYIQIAIMINTSVIRLSIQFYVSTGLQIFKKSSLCKWIFHDLLHSICIMMIRIRISNLWMKNMSIMSQINVFRTKILPPSENIISRKGRFTFLYSLHSFFHLKPAYLIGSLGSIDALKQYYFFKSTRGMLEVVIDAKTQKADFSSQKFPAGFFSIFDTIAFWVEDCSGKTAKFSVDTG